MAIDPSTRGSSVLRLALVVVGAVLAGLALQQILRATVWAPGEPENLDRGRTARSLGSGDRPVVVATDLEVPWEIRFLPGGDLLVTERPGRLVRLTADGRRMASHEVPDVRHVGEGGLMGMALHPDFEENRQVYLCFTTGMEGGLTNRVERYRLGAAERAGDPAGAGLTERTEIVTGMPGARFHDGCRLEFGPDGHLWITMGDATDAQLAQDPGSLAGSILRVTDDGAAAGAAGAVYSWGHRNPQGLAFDDRGRLWATEHGRSGRGSGMDEVNRIEAGRNYGWPVIEGDESGDAGEDKIAPVVHSGPDVTWAPAGAAWSGGSLYFAGLRGQALYELRVGSRDVDLGDLPVDLDVIPHLHREYGRLRAVRIGPDGMLYFGTSNRDGRGSPHRDDDRILKVDPSALR